MEGVPDKMLFDIARATGGEKMVGLALELGIDMADAKRYEETNTLSGYVSTRGTRDLLIDWRQRTYSTQQRRVLKQALVEAGLEGIAAKFLGHPNKRARLEGTSLPHQPSTSTATEELEPDGGYYTSFKVDPAKYDKAIHQPESTYETWKSAEKGLVYILNNNKFPNHTERKERLGSEIDVANMKHVFSELGYKPKIHTDLSRDEILESIDKIVSDINAEPDKHTSLCLVIMSHGNKDGISGTDSRKGDQRIVTIDEIKKKISGRNCKGLLGKPKLLFIQACRGGDVTRSAIEPDQESSEQGTSSDMSDAEVDHVSLNFADATMPIVDVDEEGDQDVPENSDIFVANATSSGYFALRDRKEGSWFMQALSEVFLAHANVDEIHELMRKVAARVAKGFRTRTKNLPSVEVRQTTAYEDQSMLKQFYFFPKYPGSNKR